MPDLILAVPALLLALALRGQRIRSRDRSRARARALGFFAEPCAPMPPLDPPRAANDDVLAPLLEGVGHELRRAGYLR